jgi:hypothetical protein
MFDHQRLAKDEFVNELGSLCNSGASGTMFVVTSENHQAKIVLQDGRIIAAFLRPLSGVDVINALAREQQLTFSFNDTVLMGVGVGSQVLPDTPSLLEFMKNGFGTIPGFTATAPTKTNATSQTIDSNTAAQAPDSATQGQAMDANSVRQALAEEATEFLGPIAGPICDEYLAKCGGILSRQEILQTINLLQRDINDSDKALRFFRSVHSRLGL